jgi:hypothetical protein
MTEAFDATIALIALVSDAKACARRLAELKTTMDEIEKAQATLDAHRSAVAADKASGDAREKALREREVAVAIGERALNTGREEVAAARRELAPGFHFNSNFELGSMGPGGITREA